VAVAVRDFLLFLALLQASLFTTRTITGFSYRVIALLPNLNPGRIHMGALRTKMIEEMKLRNFSPRTQQSYLAAMIGLVKHYRRSPTN
jgi:hypothetical protein